MSVKSQQCGLTSSKLKKGTTSKISEYYLYYYLSSCILQICKFLIFNSDGEDEMDEKGVIKRLVVL